MIENIKKSWPVTSQRNRTARACFETKIQSEEQNLKILNSKD
jgi:hypothetical protein